MSEALCTITITVNERKKLFRYDEAIRLLQLREPGCSGDGTFVSSVDLNRMTAAFLAAESKKGEGGR